MCIKSPENAVNSAVRDICTLFILIWDKLSILVEKLSLDRFRKEGGGAEIRYFKGTYILINALLS